MNDCSTDSTEEIAQRYAKIDKRIRVINNLENKKLPASLNIGFSNAKGQYFTWTSDDNAYAKDAFEKLRKNLIDNNVDFVFSDYQVIDEEDYILYNQVTGPVEELPYYNNVGACFLYKKEIQEHLKGYNVNKFLVEDYDFWLRVYWEYKMLHISESLYFYRIHAKSLTSERKKEVELAEIKLLEENVPSINDKKMKEKVNFKIQKFYEKREKI